jgi:AhpD family alkylhydroperoxidase
MHAPRLNALELAPEGYAALRAVEVYLQRCGLEKPLMHLLKMRASQINGCTFCLDMHSREARHEGETEQRLYLLNGWRESPLYSERERAALAWTECLTEIATRGAPDAEYEALQRQFSPKEIVDLTALIGMINLWNRVAISMRSPHRIEKSAVSRVAA